MYKTQVIPYQKSCQQGIIEFPVTDVGNKHAAKSDAQSSTVIYCTTFFLS